jgi:hypothetical protein
MLHNSLDLKQKIDFLGFQDKIVLIQQVDSRYINSPKFKK